MSKPPAIPVREAVRRSGRTRAAVYNAINEERLTGANCFGQQGVADDDKLSAFIKSAKADAKKKNGKKK